jgi:hypothetical protein
LERSIGAGWKSAIFVFRVLERLAAISLLRIQISNGFDPSIKPSVETAEHLDLVGKVEGRPS